MSNPTRKVRRSICLVCGARLFDGKPAASPEPNAAEARNRELEAEWVTKMAMREDGADVRAGTTCKFSSQHHLGQCPHCGEDGRITNGEFYEALEILGHETVEDCPLSEEQIENLAKTLKTLTAERDQLREQLAAAREATCIVRMQDYFELDTVQAVSKLYCLWQKALHENPQVAELREQPAAHVLP